MPAEFNILLSSAGRRVALLNIFRATLNEMGLRGRVIAVDTSRLSSAFQSADRAYQVPHCSSPEFIPTVLEICRLNCVSLLVPSIDTELPIYVSHRAEFEAIGTKICISDSEVIAIGMDKRLTHQWLVKNGLPTVQQATPEQIATEPSGWRFPLIVKPTCGSSSIGVNIVRNSNELVSATRNGEFIVQTIAPGNEFTIDMLVNLRGDCVCAIPRRRFETRTGEVSKGMTQRIPELINVAKTFCSKLSGAYGVLNVQLFWDEAREALNIIEFNPRFGGGFPLAWQAGGKFPQWIIEELLGFPPTSSMAEWRDRLVMLRYDEAVFVDAAQVGI